MAAVRLPGDTAVWWQRLPVPTGRGKRGKDTNGFLSPLDSPDLPLAGASEMLG